MKVLCRSAAVEEDRFTNEDVAIEILSRLPIKSVQELSCVSKRWFGIFTSPIFANAHFQRSPRSIPGLFVQGVNYCSCCEKVADYEDIDYISSTAGEEGKHGTNSKKIFKFLPERKIRVLASSNGVVLCCNVMTEVEFVGEDESHKQEYPKKVVLYVCNPLTKEWTSLNPKGRYKSGCSFGFAYDPFGSSSTCTGASFQVIMIKRPGRLGQDPYHFNIYSSKTGRWRKSKQVCMLSHGLYLHQSCYAEGVFYWRTTDHSILAFDIERERCEVIKLPGHKMKEGGKCMGVSEGKLQYVTLNLIELVIWELDNSRGPPNWVVRHIKLMKDTMDPRFYIRFDDTDPIELYNRAHLFTRPYALQDDMLYMLFGSRLGSYNVKTGKIEELCYCVDMEASIRAITVIPYFKTLLQVQNSGSAIVGGTK